MHFFIFFNRIYTRISWGKIFQRPKVYMALYCNMTALGMWIGLACVVYLIFLPLVLDFSHFIRSVCALRISSFFLSRRLSLHPGVVKSPALSAFQTNSSKCRVRWLELLSVRVRRRTVPRHALFLDYLCLVWSLTISRRSGTFSSRCQMFISFARFWN